MTVSPRARQLVFLALFAGALFAVNIGGYDLWPPDEPRFAEVAREMMEFEDYLVPRVNSEPYREKPPLLFWAIVAVSAPVGDVTSFTARLPSVLAGVATVLLTYLLAERLCSRRAAWWSAVVLITNWRFWWQARTVQIDMLLTACMALSLCAFWRWHEERRTGWLVAFYAGIAAGVYAKGPPALVFPLLLALAFYWKRREDRRALRLVAGIAAVAVAIALWLIPARLAAAGEVSAADADIASNLFRQTIGRFLLGVSKAQPPWYYLTTVPADLMPWTLVLPWTVLWTWRERRKDPAMRLLLCWIVPAFIFFSISIGKRSIYILPLWPAFAILIGRSLMDLIDGDHALWRGRTAMASGAVLLAIAAAAFYAATTPYAEGHTAAAVIAGLCALAFALDTFRSAFRRGAPAPHLTMACHFSGLVLLVALLGLPILNEHKSYRTVCAPVRELAREGEEFDLYMVRFSREQFIFYTRRFHEPVLTEPPRIEPPEGMDQRELVRRLRRLDRAAGAAVATVPIDSFERVTEEEAATLREALYAALDEADVDTELVRRFKAALTADLAEFVDRFTGPEPAFMFVMVRDWRWLLPLDPRLRELTLVMRDQAGRRDVLLFANDAGAELLEKASRDSSGGKGDLARRVAPGM